MQEHAQPYAQSAPSPISIPANTLLANAETLAINRAGRLTADQVRRLGATIGFARWLLYPLGIALLVVVFIVGLFAAGFGSALQLPFQMVAGLYGLLLAGLLLGFPLINDRGALAQIGCSGLLGLGFSFFVWTVTQDVEIFIVSALMFGILVGFGGIAQIANGGGKSPATDTPPKSPVRIALAITAMICLTFWALWFLGDLALLILFLIRVNWVGPAVVFGLFYALFVWATADEFFKGRAIRHAPVATRTGEVTWDAPTAKHVARVDGKTYHALAALPEPGLYRFYCLPTVAYVVSAERLTEAELVANPSASSSLASLLDPMETFVSASEQAARLVLLKALMKNLKFHRADLKANQQGHVSFGQFIKRALPQVGQIIVIAYCTAAGGLLIGTILTQVPVVDAFATVAARLNLVGLGATLALIAFCALILVVPVSLRLFINRMPRMLNLRVIAIDGAVTHPDINGDTASHSFHVKHYTVWITGQAQPCAIPLRAGHAFSPERRYRFYIHVATRDILSAVPLDTTGVSSQGMVQAERGCRHERAGQFAGIEKASGGVGSSP